MATDTLQFGLVVVAVGFILLFGLWTVARMSIRYEGFGKVFAVIVGLSVIGYGGMLVAGKLPGGGLPPFPPGSSGDAPQWNWRVSTTESDANHDVATEFPDAPFTACASFSPVGTVAVWDTDSFWDGATSSVQVEIDVDDDLAVTAASYSAPDCGNLDVFLELGNLVDGNGDGLQDDVPYFGRWRTISSVTQIGSANNGSQTSSTNVFAHSSVAGWHLGFGDELDAPGFVHAASDHGYVAPCVPGAAGYSSESPASSCYSRWVPLGVYDDGDPDVVSIWWVLSNQPFGYSAVKSNQISAVIDLGTPSGYISLTLTFVLDSIG